MHEGSLVISGSMPELKFTRRANSSFAVAARVVETAKALEAAGFTKREAKAAAEQTRTHVGMEDWPLEAWLRFALSKCPRGPS